MQSWKDLLVLVYPRYRGPFIQLDCGWLAAAPPDQCPDTAWQLRLYPMSAAQVEATLASRWPAEPRINSGSYQHPKTETFNEPPKFIWGCDAFKY